MPVACSDRTLFDQGRHVVTADLWRVCRWGSVWEKDIWPQGNVTISIILSPWFSPVFNQDPAPTGNSWQCEGRDWEEDRRARGRVTLSANTVLAPPLSHPEQNSIKSENLIPKKAFKSYWMFPVANLLVAVIHKASKHIKDWSGKLWQSVL